MAARWLYVHRVDADQLCHFGFETIRRGSPAFYLPDAVYTSNDVVWLGPGLFECVDCYGDRPGVQRLSNKTMKGVQ